MSVFIAPRYLRFVRTYDISRSLMAIWTRPVAHGSEVEPTSPLTICLTRMSQHSINNTNTYVHNMEKRMLFMTNSKNGVMIIFIYQHGGSIEAWEGSSLMIFLPLRTMVARCVPII